MLCTLQPLFMIFFLFASGNSGNWSYKQEDVWENMFVHPHMRTLMSWNHDKSGACRHTDLNFLLNFFFPEEKNNKMLFCEH